MRELRKALILSIGGSVALFLFLMVLFIFQISSLIHLSQDTDNSNKVIAAVIDLQKTAIDMETGKRGFALTQKKSFLAPYYSGQKNFPLQMSHLNQLLAGNTFYYNETEEMAALMKRWFYLQDRGGVRNLSDEVKSKKLMDQFREITSDILDEENKKLENNKLKRISNANNTILYGILLTIVLGCFLVMIIRQQMVRLFLSYENNYNHMIQARKELETLNRDLEKKVTERTTSLKSVNNELEAFCYSVSHDLRSPLRGIDGFSLALLEDYSEKLDSEGKRYLSFIREGVQRMGHLIDDLLRLSRINRSAVQFQYFDLFELVSEVIYDIKTSSGSLQTQFVTKLQKPHYVYADRGLLRILLENLYQNAIKYSSKETLPVVEFGRCNADDGDEDECFYIKDNGVGFDMEHYAKLFAAFQRLHNEKEYPGTGIGLATVKRIIARHNGRIWADSKAGEGATFYFKLPDSSLQMKGGMDVHGKNIAAH